MHDFYPGQEFLLFAEDEQYEVTLVELLTQSLNGSDFRSHITDNLKAYTGIKDIKGNKIYDGDVVSEEGHYVNSDRISYAIINYQVNHGAWLRGKSQRLTPKNVKQYNITVMPRDTKFYEVPKSGWYYVAYDKYKTGEPEYFIEKQLIPNPARVNSITYEEAEKLQKS